ncbi:SDR family NAD(P)-dependent oxidoreductase [Algiphilus sp.]|uniref:SDR family NAD(P)-dependent oxidoreductase n=1 Tax=Algiphilus sp. TaxID=1872431 RepID=UPI0025B914EC|nr:SDR family NAD(P)-dependent oxidoreductase [Algiphilus sp.]MCK5770568.1 SDR family NAD(P)-dependent oxidoreductase [Algiphilus sp.]
MITDEARIRAGHSAGACLWYAADLRNLPQWLPAALYADKITEGVLGAGARFEVRLRIGFRRVALHFEILRFSPPFTATLRGEGPGVTLVATLRAESEQAGRGAILAWDTEVRLDGTLRARIAEPGIRLALRRAARGLQHALRMSPPPRLGTAGWLADRLVLPGAARFTRQGFAAARLAPLVARAEGRHVAITGATGGLGEAAAMTLARHGARITIVGRDGERLRRVVRRLRIDAGCRATVVEADLLDLDSTARAADALRADPPDALINNAGALFGERAETGQGFERTLAVNLLSPVILMDAVAPAMTAGGRIINVVSGGMYLTPLALDDLNFERGRFDGAVAYGRAKRALTLLTARRARSWPHLALHAVHPGWADTPGVRSALPAFRRVMRPFLRDADQGADSIVWLALDDAAAASRRGVWFDRAPHPIDVLPATRLATPQIDALDRRIATLVGPWLSSRGLAA